MPVTAVDEDVMCNRTSELLDADTAANSTHNVTAGNILLQMFTANVSAPEGCQVFNFEDMEFLPWDNPDNIVSAAVEDTVRRLKDGLLLPVLFLIGGPANVINMAVFYKQGLKDRVNLCLFALSLADELYLVQAMLTFGIDQLHLQFTTKERFGPMTRFMLNNNLAGFFGFTFTSQVLSAIIASERCLCVLYPLRFQTLLQTKTMAVIVVTVYLVVMTLYFFISTRYQVACVFDTVHNTVRYTVLTSKFYQKHEKLITYFDSFVFGAGIPVVVIIVVTTTTTLTAIKIRQAAAWRAGTSSTSSSTSSSSPFSSISTGEVGLTKMLIGSSVLFIVCVSPMALLRFCWLFLPEMNVGRRNHNFFLISQWIKESFSYSNSTFNIFVYYIIGSRYRETFWALMGRKRRNKAKGKSNKTTTTTV